MVQYTTSIKIFQKQGEKTGWTYIEVPADIAEQLQPGQKKSFRVKGKLDAFSIKGVALLPMGGGSFIMPMNQSMRKGTGKKHGAMITLKLEVDKAAFKFDKDFMECLEDEPTALAFFKTIPPSFQKYFSKWISDAKTVETKTKRIAYAVNSLSRHQNFGEMIREMKKEREERLK